MVLRWPTLGPAEPLINLVPAACARGAAVVPLPAHGSTQVFAGDRRVGTRPGQRLRRRLKSRASPPKNFLGSPSKSIALPCAC